MTVVYRRPRLRLARGEPVEPELVRALQRDLRALGYLRGGLDGGFGPETERAVRALQHDLLFNDGRGRDRDAPVAVRDFNAGRVARVDGLVDEGLAACVEALLEDPRVPPLPRSDAPARDNARALEAIGALERCPVPVPFLLTVLAQESGLLHYRLPTPRDPDDYLVVGLDRNDAGQPDRITSRGYGVGQYTLFHHPPWPEEVTEVMLDPAGNVQRAIAELRDKFDRFVMGSTPGTRADDRLAEVGPGALRACRYSEGDPRFQTDCGRCAAAAPRVTLGADTPLFPGSPEQLRPTPYHRETRYEDIPDRAAFGCDWPYVIRRYNGAGINSYHYQAQVLRRLLESPVS
ncbi:MAG TPA: peptidoglycan-binding domain-containing protein [Methylomirabilota bacterium]|nr:peptidoglycan-binding domain-containing protein [Methylomirabilota bacterium]